jgi:ABC-2 type transport system ATP-binding protein
MVLHIGVTDRLAAAHELVRKIPGVTESELTNQHIRVTLDPQQNSVAEIARQLVTGGFGLSRIEEEKVNLETAFMRLTKGLVQ